MTSVLQIIINTKRFLRKIPNQSIGTINLILRKE